MDTRFGPAATTNPDDVFAVQGEIAGEIAKMLLASTTGRPRAAWAKSNDNFEAYNWYLQSRHHLNRQTREALHRAIDWPASSCWQSGRQCARNRFARKPKYRILTKPLGNTCRNASLFVGRTVLTDRETRRKPLATLTKGWTI
jgi:hypothetical protein